MGANKFFVIDILFISAFYFPPETYTLLGNSFGFPCVFPFKYNNKWYYECTRDGKESEWCATTTHYEQDEKWGFCPNAGKMLLAFSLPPPRVCSLLVMLGYSLVLDYFPSGRRQCLFKKHKGRIQQIYYSLSCLAFGTQVLITAAELQRVAEGPYSVQPIALSLHPNPSVPVIHSCFCGTHNLRVALAKSPSAFGCFVSCTFLCFCALLGCVLGLKY